MLWLFDIYWANRRASFQLPAFPMSLYAMVLSKMVAAWIAVDWVKSSITWTVLACRHGRATARAVDSHGVLVQLMYGV